MNFTTPYNSTDFFFTKEEQYIEFNTPLDSYFKMTVNITAYEYYNEVPVTKSLFYKIPLFNKKASFLLGEIIDRSMPRIKKINLRSLFQYRPAKVELIITEIDLATETVLSENTVGPIFFVSGFAPETIENNCAFLEIYNIGRRVTPDGFAFLNMILPLGTHNFKILRKDIEVDSFDINVVSSNICTRVIKLADYEAKQGDTFEIRMPDNPSLVKKLYVFPSDFYSNYIAFEDEFRLKTIIEFTGEYRFNSDFVTKMNKVQKGMVEVNQKVSSKTDLSFTINTGFLTEEEEIIIESLMSSLKAWFIIGENKSIELVPNSKKMVKIDPTTALYSYDVEFLVNSSDYKPLKVAMDQPLDFLELDEVAPTIPTDLQVSNKLSTSLTLSWSPSTDAYGVIGYDIYKDGVYLGSSPDTFFNVTGLTLSTEYDFTVKAKDAAGNRSDTSEPITVTTMASDDVTPPTAPSNLQATNVYWDELKLTWDASTDDVAVTKYLIYKDGVQIGETPALNYRVTGLSFHTYYEFIVKAMDANGNISDPSNLRTVTTAATYTKPYYFTSMRMPGYLIPLSGYVKYKNGTPWIFTETYETLSCVAVNATEIVETSNVKTCTP